MCRNRVHGVTENNMDERSAFCDCARVQSLSLDLIISIFLLFVLHMSLR